MTILFLCRATFALAIASNAAIATHDFNWSAAAFCAAALYLLETL